MRACSIAVTAFLSLALSPPIVLAQSNDCGEAPQIVVPGNYLGTVGGATSDGATGCGYVDDVWYRVEPDQDAVLVVSTCDRDRVAMTSLAVHTGCPATEANRIACGFRTCNEGQAILEANVEAGTAYYVRVAGNGAVPHEYSLRLWYEDRPRPGPDLIVGEITGFQSYPSAGGVAAYAMGATVCNVGTEDADWIGTTNRHPLVVPALYRLKDHRFEQIGLSWVKHTIAAGNDSICGTCNGNLGQVLGVGCSDPYTASTSGIQMSLGPRSQVNATTGSFTFPFEAPDISGPLSRRLQVLIRDLEPDRNEGARYFAESRVISMDDAAAGNGLNSASVREVFLTNLLPRPLRNIARRNPAITAWRDADPSVVLVNADSMEGGIPTRYIIAARVADRGDGTWSYEYAVYNHNSDRSARAFQVAVPATSTVSDLGFHDVFYHSGDGIGGANIDSTDWTATRTAGRITWETVSFDDNPNGNALRWGTLYNFRFVSDTPPAPGDALIHFFKPGDPGEPDSVIASGVPVPTGAPTCRPDWNTDGELNSQDFFDFLAAFFQGSADFNRDGFTNSQDFFDFLALFFDGCE